MLLGFEVSGNQTPSNYPTVEPAKSKPPSDILLRKGEWLAEGTRVTAVYSNNNNEGEKTMCPVVHKSVLPSSSSLDRDEKLAQDGRKSTRVTAIYLYGSTNAGKSTLAEAFLTALYNTIGAKYTTISDVTNPYLDIDKEDVASTYSICLDDIDPKKGSCNYRYGLLVKQLVSSTQVILPVKNQKGLAVYIDLVIFCSNLSPREFADYFFSFITSWQKWNTLL